MLAAPLFAGNDLSQMDTATREILTNREMIAIDQDPLGMQGFKIKDYGELEIYYKPLQNNEAAICIFNRYDQTVNLEMNWKDFSLKARNNGKELKLTAKIDRRDIVLDGLYNVYDLWKKKELGNNSQLLKIDLLSHDVAVMKLSRQ
jgi:alpha-galactosidase